MAITRLYRGVWVLVIAAGCSQAPDEGELAATTQTVSTSNALTANALTANALTANALTANALTANALTANALTANALTANALTANALTANGTEGSQAREVLRYVYSCAMPAGTSMTLNLAGVDYTFDGAIGLAPRWGMPLDDTGNGKCDHSCQRWISACLFARTNAYGVPVPISIRGNNPAIATVSAEEMAEFSLREGSYYGNVFGGNSYGDTKSACTGPGSNMPSETARLCSNGGTEGNLGSPCNLDVQGECFIPAAERVVDPEFDSPSAECASMSSNGAVESCGVDATNQPYSEVITVYLQAPADRCGNGICEAGETTTNCGDCTTGWAKSIADKYFVDPTAGVAVDSNGNIIVAGRTSGGTADFGGGPLTSGSGFFLASYTTAGIHASSRRIGSGEVSPQALATDSSGNIFVTGYYRGTASMGGGTFVTGVDANNRPLRSAFVGKYTAAGSHLWSVSLAGAEAQRLLIDGSGNPVVAGVSPWAGSFDGTRGPTFLQRLSGNSGSVLDTVARTGGGDIFDLVIDSTGRILLSDVLGTSLYSSTYGLAWTAASLKGDLAVDGSGNLYVTSGRDDSINSTGSINRYHYDSNGSSLTWSKTIDADASGGFDFSLDVSDYQAPTTSLGPDGNLVVTGNYTSRLAIGNHLIESGQTSIFLEGFAAKLTPAGKVLWLRVLSTPVQSRISGVALDASGIVMTGRFKATVDFFGFGLTGARQSFDDTSSEMFLTRFQDNLIGEEPNDLAGGAVVVPYREGVHTFTGTTVALADNYEASCGGGARGADAVYQFSLPSATRVRANTTGSAFDTVLHIRDGWTTAGEVACNDDANSGNQSSLDVTLGAGTYLVFVDGKTNTGGNYTLNVEFEDPTASDTEASATFISATNTGGRFYGTTTGLSDNYAASCGGAASVDAVYKIVLTAPRHLHADTAASEFNTVLYVKSGAERACNDDTATTVHSALDIDLPAGTHYLYVDGKAGGHGAYRLDVKLANSLNQAPDADAGPDQTRACLAPDDLVAMTLDGSASTDSEGDALTFNWKENSTVIGTGVGPSVALAVGTHSITLEASDGFSTSSDSVTINMVADTSAPTVTAVGGNQTAECGSVFVDPGVTATDDCDGDLGGQVTTTGVVQTSSLGTYPVHYAVSDRAGNASSADRVVTVVDTTGPVFTSVPSNINVIATSSSGNAVTFAMPTASDSCDTNATVTCSRTSGSTFALGTTTVTCTASDATANTTTTTFTVSVVYAWSNLLAPINLDGSSVFKRNSTIPLRFQLTGDSAGITTATAYVFVAKVSNGVVGTELEAVSNNAATSGNQFQSQTSQYVYNLGTSGLTIGTYLIRVDLGDGVARSVLVSLK